MARYSIFTKPWRTLPIPEMIQTVKSMGYNAIEFPLRDDAQVSPAQAEEKLPLLVKELADNDIVIDDVASTPEERVFAACAANHIPMIRVMFSPPPLKPYIQEEEAYLRLVESWIPLCEKYGVMVGIQMHYGTGCSNTAEMMRIVSRFDKRSIGAIWDAGHSGLAGEVCEQAIDLCWSHLCLVNFKAARYVMQNRGPDQSAVFEPYFCPGPDGQCSWPRAVKHLRAKGYTGTWCLPAEYTRLTGDEETANAMRDLAWLKSLVER